MKDAKAFQGWAEGQGGIVEPPTNEYELARIRHADGVLVIYQGKRGLSFSDSIARSAWDAFKTDKGFPLTKRHKRTKKEGTLRRIRQRDGEQCWFCSREFSGDLPETLEHLLSISHGGNNAIQNLVLACEPCNVKAGNLSIAEKVLLRVTGMGAPGFAKLGDTVTVTECNGTNRCDVVHDETGDSAYFALTCGAQRLEPNN